MTRLISGVVLALAALAAIMFLPSTGLRLLACGIAAVAAVEYLRMVSGPGTDPMFAFVAVMCWFLAQPDRGLAGFAIAAVVIAAAEVLLRNQRVELVAARLFAVLYIALPLALLVAIHALGGREAVLLLIGTVVVSDSAQYYAGRALGRRPLAPAISPKKTIEGALGGLVAATAFLVISGRFVFPFVRRGTLVAAGVAIVVAGIAGDLFESRLKRAAALKDSSSIIPGHGGVLDRIDGLLFAAPVFYLFVHGVM